MDESEDEEEWGPIFDTNEDSSSDDSSSDDPGMNESEEGEAEEAEEVEPNEPTFIPPQIANQYLPTLSHADLAQMPIATRASWEMGRILYALEVVYRPLLERDHYWFDGVTPEGTLVHPWVQSMVMFDHLREDRNFLYVLALKIDILREELWSLFDRNDYAITRDEHALGYIDFARTSMRRAYLDASRVKEKFKIEFDKMERAMFRHWTEVLGHPMPDVVQEIPLDWYEL